jgi:hypothetical protein
MRKKDFMDIHDIIGKDDGELRLKYMSLSLSLSNFQEIRPKVDNNFPSHVHTCFELIIPIKERYCCTLCNRELTVEYGNFILMQPGQSHIDHLSQNEPFLCIHFNISSRDNQKNKQQLFIPGLLPDKQIAPIPSEEFICDVFSLAKKYKEQIYSQTKDENLKIIEFDCTASIVRYINGKQRTYVDILISPIVKISDDVDCDTVLTNYKCVAPNFV